MAAREVRQMFFNPKYKIKKEKSLTAQICEENFSKSQKFFLGRYIRSSKAVILGPDFSVTILFKYLFLASLNVASLIYNNNINAKTKNPTTT